LIFALMAAEADSTATALFMNNSNSHLIYPRTAHPAT